jgi:phage-related protein
MILLGWGIMSQKPLIWISSSKKDLLSFPQDVKSTMGYALRLAQTGNRYQHTKTLKGFQNSGIIEIIDTHASGTYRVMYTITMPQAVFVLHAFQKKSTQGIKTAQKDIELVKDRLKQAHEIYKDMIQKGLL